MKRIRQRIVAALAVLCTSAGLLLVAVTPAQAYTCSGARSISANDGTSSASVTFYPRCSDGRAHWSGTIRDVSCDDRSARMALYANLYEGQTTWTAGYEAPNGCNTQASFSGHNLGLPRPGGSYWTLHLNVKSCNFWRCSTGTTKIISG